MVGKGLMGDDKAQKKLDTSKDDDAAQAAYDYHMMMSKGIMSLKKKMQGNLLLLMVKV